MLTNHFRQTEDLFIHHIQKRSHYILTKITEKRTVHFFQNHPKLTSRQQARPEKQV